MGQRIRYGGDYFPGDDPRIPVKVDPIQEYRLGLEDAVVRMRPNPRRDNGLVIRMQGDQRVGDPELMELVQLRALYKSLLEQGYTKL